MNRKIIVAFTVAFAAIAGVALSVTFWSRGRPGADPTGAPRSEPTADSSVTPGIRTLDQLATVINSGDQAAPGRVRAVAQAIAQGRASANEIDGVPITATVIPA